MAERAMIHWQEDAQEDHHTLVKVYKIIIDKTVRNCRHINFCKQNTAMLIVLREN